MSEQKRKPYKINWFKFYPSDMIEIIEMTDNEAGKRIKSFIKNLMSNRAPDGSLEARMIAEASEFSRRQSERIAAYWKNRRDNQQPPPQRPDKPPRAPRQPRIPPSPVMEQNPEKFR